MFDTTTPKNRQLAIILAFAGMVIPLAGFHKFYLGQPRWGLLYLLLSWTPIPHIASAIEAVWYLTQDGTLFGSTPTGGTTINPPSNSVNGVADAIRELDKLRADGLISEYEFEQKRRQWLDRV
jgi:TM2 domain-containing membrane protein YozV